MTTALSPQSLASAQANAPPVGCAKIPSAVAVKLFAISRVEEAGFGNGKYGRFWDTSAGGALRPPTIIAQRPLRPHGSPALGDGGQGLHVTLPPDPSLVVPQHMPSEGWHWAPINPEVEQSFAAPPRHTPPTHISPLSAVHRFPSSQRDPSERVCPVHTPA